LKPLREILDVARVRACAERGRQIDPIGRPAPSQAFDLLAAIIADGLEDGSSEDRFVELMRGYFQNQAATTRWENLAALAHEYGADFRELGVYLREKGVPMVTREPR
jgi:hypothetical protein